MAFPAAFVAGLLISFTPCVYPVIPIQLGFIGGRTAASEANASELAPRFNLRGFQLSVLFVIGMSIIYAALGAFASLTGTLFGSWASSPWTYIAVANVILLLALSMLDVFSIQAPQFVSKWNPDRKGKGYLSALLIGASSGLVVGGIGEIDHGRDRDGRIPILLTLADRFSLLTRVKWPCRMYLSGIFIAEVLSGRKLPEKIQESRARNVVVTPRKIHRNSAIASDGFRPRARRRCCRATCRSL